MKLLEICFKDCRNEEVSRSTERRVQGQQKDDDRDGGTTLGAHVTREAKGRHLGANDAHSHVDGDAQNDDDDVNQLYQKRWSSKHWNQKVLCSRQVDVPVEINEDKVASQLPAEMQETVVKTLESESLEVLSCQFLSRKQTESGMPKEHVESESNGTHGKQE